jgi:polyphenol oxidase
MNPAWLVADWPAPARVRTCLTTRQGGVSLPPWDSFNLGTHVGDRPEHVASNRKRLVDALGCQPAWLEQTHSTRVVAADPYRIEDADASWTGALGVACAVMTADCLPVLFCDRAGTRVAAAHAGWRGLAGGVLENTVTALGVAPEELLAWLGSAIGPRVFEVGPEVREAFLTCHPQTAAAFTPAERAGHFLADIYLLARLRLEAVGLTAVHGGGLCTFSDADRFYSYRRDGQTGRMAALIWLEG